uniref:Uncharacterized protein n=1 Tax=Prymnesium polylepis TaxID=72548 RepID=A0A7S4HDG5_9EUKA|mmetsp:Transcript_12319/g.31166  ORF Transcript_12319/g.31166 Transcript_12319/m.31166 type:complete len:236 (+) Transcript_12319:54-761(+)
MTFAWNVPISLGAQLKTAREQQKNNRGLVVQKSVEGITLSRRNGGKISKRALAKAIKNIKHEELVQDAAEAFLTLAQGKQPAAAHKEMASGTKSPISELSDAGTVSIDMVPVELAEQLPERSSEPSDAGESDEPSEAGESGEPSESGDRSESGEPSDDGASDSEQGDVATATPQVVDSMRAVLTTQEQVAAINLQIALLVQQQLVAHLAQIAAMQTAPTKAKPKQRWAPLPTPTL